MKVFTDIIEYAVLGLATLTLIGFCVGWIIGVAMLVVGVLS
jgi:hypothetical protein